METDKAAVLSFINCLSNDFSLIGFTNYVSVFTDPTFLSSLDKTFLYVFFVVILSNVLGIALALLLMTAIKGRGLFRTCFFAANMIASSITICTFMAISKALMSFDVNLALTAGGPYKTTELLAFKIYQTAFSNFEYGKGQAAGTKILYSYKTIGISYREDNVYSCLQK